MQSVNQQEIPVVDLKGQYGFCECLQTTQDIHAALSSIGFIYFVNHGIPIEKVTSPFVTSQKFFDLPFEVKKKYIREPNKYAGYVAPSQEILESTNSEEVREAFDFVSEKSDKFPVEVPDFKETAVNLYLECYDFARRLLRSLAVALGQDADFFVNNHKLMGTNENRSIFRTLYYPPLRKDQIKPGTMRCGEHTDYGTFTLLFQDNIGGLEVLTKNKQWVEAKPIPGALLVNVGDLLQIWTDNEYPATKHRVRIPQEELKLKTIRQSMVYFVHPDNDFEIRPLNGNRSNYSEPTTSRKWTQMKLDASYKY
ncbi:uncharacterized protein LOC136031088 [Artemia franciscana]|uniref:uncharacterized protein LOC136031088 n=1 Tax=Artemia franciscana TaxID=6661 RepID=UPI0032DB4B67